jgi:uncharacterized protein
MTKKINSFGLDKKTFEYLITILGSLEQIDEAIIFGSRARGDYKPRSDIDLAIITHESGIDGKLLSLIEESDILLSVDVVVITDTINATLLKAINKEGKSIYKKESSLSN